MKINTDVTAAVETVKQFAAEQLAWHSRRGTPSERDAARRFASRLGRVAKAVEREMAAAGVQPGKRAA